MQEEPDAKWPLLTLTRVREALSALRHQDATSPAVVPTTMGVDDISRQAPDAEAKPHEAADSNSRNSGGRQASAVQQDPSSHQEPPAELAKGQAYARLAAVDPLRSGYYKDAAAGSARVVLRTAGPS